MRAPTEVAVAALTATERFRATYGAAFDGPGGVERMAAVVAARRRAHLARQTAGKAPTASRAGRAVPAPATARLAPPVTREQASAYARALRRLPG